jgi:hypothetical protein
MIPFKQKIGLKMIKFIIDKIQRKKAQNQLVLRPHVFAQDFLAQRSINMLSKFLNLSQKLSINKETSK